MPMKHGETASAGAHTTTKCVDCCVGWRLSSWRNGVTATALRHRNTCCTTDTPCRYGGSKSRSSLVRIASCPSRRQRWWFKPRSVCIASRLPLPKPRPRQSHSHIDTDTENSSLLQQRRAKREIRQTWDSTMRCSRRVRTGRPRPTRTRRGQGLLRLSGQRHGRPLCWTSCACATARTLWAPEMTTAVTAVAAEDSDFRYPRFVDWTLN
jgi:hypothetical protein